MRSVNLHLTSSTGCQPVKHGPRTILLKLLTILLSGSPYRWWTRQQGTAGLIPQQSQLKRSMSPARRPFRAISARIVELAGTNQFKMFATVNTKKFPRGILDQVISNSSATARAQRASWSGPQASSCKRQAFEPTCSSIKRQASSPKLQASSVKPQAASSLILDPRNMDIGEVLEEQGPRVFAKIKVLCG